MKPLEVIFPELRKPNTGALRRIEVGADSLRAGKTTAAGVIAQGLRQIGLSVFESYEDWQSNPYLRGSYSDPDKNFLDSQKWFAHRKWEQLNAAQEVTMLMQEPSPETDFCYPLTRFLLGQMSQAHFDEYRAYYQSLDWGAVPAPDLLVYLAASDDVLLQRAMDSRREFETVEPEYFLMMKHVNRMWLAQAENSMNILVVDTDKLDFASNKKAQDTLVEMVCARISST